MKFAFCTCVQIGLDCMNAIYKVGGNIDLILTLPDEEAKNKSGRIYVDKFGAENQIPIVKTNHINDEIVIDSLIKYDIDWLYIIGWSQIASSLVLDTVKKGAIGAHPTLLPQGRGRASIPWAIIKGLEKTGVTFFKMDKGVDTGSILAQKTININETETATTLYAKVVSAHASLIKSLHPQLIHHDVVGIKQNENIASYWGGRKPEDGMLDQSMTVNEVDRLVRATTKPYPGAYFIEGEKKIIIWSGQPGNIHGAAKIIEFADGSYSVVDYQIVPNEK